MLTWLLRDSKSIPRGQRPYIQALDDTSVDFTGPENLSLLIYTFWDPWYTPSATICVKVDVEPRVLDRTVSTMSMISVISYLWILLIWRDRETVLFGHIVVWIDCNMYTLIPFDEAFFWAHSVRDGLQYKYTILDSKWIQIDLLFMDFQLPAPHRFVRVVPLRMGVCRASLGT